VEYFLQQTINGITLGAVYGLIAIGYTMVYGIVGMINFAHGEIYMIGAFVAVIAFTLLGMMGVTWVPAAVLIVLVATMLFTAAYGWAVERIAYRPLRGSFRLAPLIVTGAIPLIETGHFHVAVTHIQILIIALTIVLMIGFSWLITRTRFGRAQRACEQDQTMAALLGIDVDRTISMTFMIGAILAAVAGVMVTLYYGVVDFFIGFQAGLKAFAAAVLGGIGSLPGAMLGGFLIGLVEAYWSAYFSIEYKDIATFSILILVLIFRPTGLLGRPDVEKV
jgi:branched-chain amino acid transport system permease protein